MRFSRPSTPQPVARRILVVGAGAGGLAAARALTSRGHEVIVLEARDRIGGRIWTRDGFDLGAHWIHGTEGNPVTDFARREGLATLFVGGDSTYIGGWEHLSLIRPGRSPLTEAEKLESILRADEVRDALDAWRRERSSSHPSDRSFADLAGEILDQRGWPPEAAEDVLWHLTALGRDDMVGGLAGLSALWWDDGYDVYGFGDSVFEPGFGAFVEHLAQDLDIRLQSPVTRVEWSSPGDRGVRVETATGTFEGDAVVLTLPLGLLKANAVRFDPPLPEPKQTAIERLGFGHLAKIALSFARPFWPRRTYAFGWMGSRLERRPTHLVSSWPTHRRAELVLLMGGEDAVWLEALSEQEAREWALEVIRELFGGQVEAPLGIRRTAWSSDPWSRGSYSYLRVGGTPADIDALAAPVGDRLFFAGEATSRECWATVHGAYLSGLREAARITGDASIMPERHYGESRRWRELQHRASRFFRLRSQVLPEEELRARSELLQGTGLFRELGETELWVLAAMFDRRRYVAGEVICRQGDPAGEAFVVEEGTLEVRRSDRGSALARYGRGAIAGEFGLFTDHRRNADLVALADSVVLVIDYPRLLRYLLAFPEASLALLRQVVNEFMRQSQTIW